MGFDYLDGHRWAAITREERFFCQVLYQRILEESPQRFVEYLVSEFGLDLSPEGEWEVGYEVCFYRDLRYLRRQPKGEYSDKRTFDLCLFGKDSIVIIEAKAAEGFSREQNASFVQDLDHVTQMAGVQNVILVGLCSSRYKVETDLAETFEGRILRWDALAARYGGDEALLRADAVFEESKPFANRGKNADAILTGTKLVAAHQRGARWLVGRMGGLTGDRLAADTASDGWRKQNYEVIQTERPAPNSNWFTLAEFVERVGG